MTHDDTSHDDTCMTMGSIGGPMTHVCVLSMCVCIGGAHDAWGLRVCASIFMCMRMHIFFEYVCVYMHVCVLSKCVHTSVYERRRDLIVSPHTRNSKFGIFGRHVHKRVSQLHVNLFHLHNQKK